MNPVGEAVNGLARAGNVSIIYLDSQQVLHLTSERQGLNLYSTALVDWSEYVGELGSSPNFDEALAWAGYMTTLPAANGGVSDFKLSSEPLRETPYRVGIFLDHKTVKTVTPNGPLRELLAGSFARLGDAGYKHTHKSLG